MTDLGHPARPAGIGRFRSVRLWLAATLAFCLVCGLGGSAYALTCASVTDAPPRGLSRNLGALKIKLLRYACSGAYERDIARVLRRAQRYLVQRAGKVAKPAVVLDIDETAVSNWPAMVANDFGYIPGGPCDGLPKGPCGWHAWERTGKAEAIAPTLELFRAAKRVGASVFFLTGRRDNPEHRAATEQNLRNAGYDGWTRLIMRPPEAARLTAQAYKTAERAKIAAEGYTIVVNVGDQRSDLAGGYAERAFLVPNPFYYIR